MQVLPCGLALILSLFTKWTLGFLRTLPESIAFERTSPSCAIILDLIITTNFQPSIFHFPCAIASGTVAASDSVPVCCKFSTLLTNTRLLFFSEVIRQVQTPAEKSGRPTDVEEIIAHIKQRLR